jgi:hypothetical protein
VAGGVPATSGGRRTTLTSAAHRSKAAGRFGSSARGAHGATLSHGRRWRPARCAGGLLGMHDEMAMARELVWVTVRCG